MRFALANICFKGGGGGGGGGRKGDLQRFVTILMKRGHIREVLLDCRLAVFELQALFRNSDILCKQIWAIDG